MHFLLSLLLVSQCSRWCLALPPLNEAARPTSTPGANTSHAPSASFSWSIGDGAAVPISIAPSVSISNLASSTNSTSTPSSANSTSSTPASSTTFSAEEADILILAPRRIDFVISQQSGAKSISAWLSTLGADGQWPGSEIDYTAGCNARRANWPAEDHWIRIVMLAAAWHGGFNGAEATYVQDSSLRAQIGLAMDWWFARDFTVDSCLDTGGRGTCPCGTPGLWNTNWFSNVIGIPRLVGQACLLLNNTLTETQFANCTHMTARTFALFDRATKPTFLVGANTLDISSIGIALGILTLNGTVVNAAYSHVHAEVGVQTGFQKDGIQGDGSFSHHLGLLYNGNYGKDYSNNVMELEIEGSGTRFAAKSRSKVAFEGLMDASRWMIYQNTVTGTLHWDFSTEGRFISFPVIDQQATSSININLTVIQELATLWGSTMLQDVYDDLTTETGTANIGCLDGNRYFWNNDYMVTRGYNYVSTLKMYSSRTRNTECTNLENPLGFHLSDGAMYTYITGDEYEDIAAAWDWNMIPGTTVDYGGTPLACTTAKQRGVESFVGGVSTGMLGAAVMRYTNPVTQALSFQKAWFFFDNDVHHVLVSILNSTGSAPVFSVLDQRKHDGPVYVDFVSVSDGNFSNPTTLFHASTGYLFPTPDIATSPQQLSLTTGRRTGNWSALGISKQPPATIDLFSAWIPHDPYADPSAAIEYTVFPGRDRDEFYEEALTSPLQTLCADTTVSAVQDRAHGTAMIAFWQPGGGTLRVPASWRAGTSGVTVTSDSAVVMIVEEQMWCVTVADPTQTLEGAWLTFDGVGRVSGGADGGFECDGDACAVLGTWKELMLLLLLSFFFFFFFLVIVAKFSLVYLAADIWI
ncbi:polysaccharide lyase family 8 protein [Ramaria rubella]|nr:polysaccharide lyase family 8 protein [Ramaria rubella]